MVMVQIYVDSKYGHGAFGSVILLCLLLSRGGAKSDKNRVILYIVLKMRF